MKFSAEEKDILVKKIQLYFDQELGQDLGSFDAQFLLDFFAEQIGPYFYNRALFDANTVLQEKMDSMSDALYEIEKPTEFIR
ncbi:DUF2164 domain-containing protein [uncultured Gilvimarinus sp.]|jgi:uncharacterized protein (DUF2164 family)|uniref:DUF2164 domain-containing protein n=1 Tax=uncultured Gilvimarinus sp. TaxID=1689143 RepID=UPI0030D6FE9D